MLGRIEQVFDAQRRFTADASHELRSPLSRLRAELEVTLQAASEPRRVRGDARSCLGEVERLSRLTEELLTLARLDAGEAQEMPARVRSPRSDSRRGGHADSASDALRRNVKIVLDVPAELAINVAPATAALVVANVLDNAVKFSPPDGEIRIRASIEGRRHLVIHLGSGLA